MEIQQLKYFVRAAQLGNFREAAEELFVSRTALSKSMARLESELGYPLFTRARDGVELTERGSRLYDIARPLICEYDRVDRAAKALRSSLEVTVLIPNSWRRAFEPHIESFSLERPDVRISIASGSDAELNQRARDGKGNLVVSHLPLTDMIDAGRALVHAPLYVAMGAQNPLATKETITREEMFSQPVLYYSCGYDKVFWVPTGGSHVTFDNDLIHIYEVLSRNEAVMPTPLLCAPEHPFNVVFRRYEGPYGTVVMSGYIPRHVADNPMLEQACLELRDALVLDQAPRG